MSAFSLQVCNHCIDLELKILKFIYTWENLVCRVFQTLSNENPKYFDTVLNFFLNKPEWELVGKCPNGGEIQFRYYERMRLKEKRRHRKQRGGEGGIW